MKIEIQHPYTKQYKSAYLITNKEPRRLVVLVRHDGIKNSTSYARYLYSVKEGRILGKDEHVDHIDGDKLNDVIENLQILTLSENVQKYFKDSNKQAVPFELVCPICGIIFYRSKSRVNFKIKNGSVPTCSRKCGGIKSHNNNNN